MRTSTRAHLRALGTLGVLAWVAGPVAGQSNNLHVCNEGDVLVLFSNPSPGSTWTFCDTTNDLYWKVYTGEHHLNHGEGITVGPGAMQGS